MIITILLLPLGHISFKKFISNERRHLTVSWAASPPQCSGGPPSCIDFNTKPTSAVDDDPINLFCHVSNCIFLWLINYSFHPKYNLIIVVIAISLSVFSASLSLNFVFFLERLRFSSIHHKQIKSDNAFLISFTISPPKSGQKYERMRIEYRLYRSAVSVRNEANSDRKRTTIIG
jgi:hypothetical protein